MRVLIVVLIFIHQSNLNIIHGDVTFINQHFGIENQIYSTGSGWKKTQDAAWSGGSSCGTNDYLVIVAFDFLNGSTSHSILVLAGSEDCKISALFNASTLTLLKYSSESSASSAGAAR